MDEKTDKPHDTRLKELFGNKEAFMSFLKDCVKPEWIDDLDESSLKRSPKTYILQDFRKKEADLVYEATLNGGKGKVIFYILQENQSRIDYRMGYRLLLYIVEILRDYYNHANEKERKRKNFKFPVVIPIVFHTGSGKWTVPLSLKEMFAGYKHFGDYVLNFKYALVDAKGYDDESVKEFQSGLLKVMMLLEKSTEFAQILKTIEKYKSELIELNDEEKRVLSVAFEILSNVHKSSQEYDLNKILYTKNEEGVSTMMPSLLDNVENYEKNLIKRAKREAKKEMKKEMKKEAYNDKIELAKKLKNRGIPIEYILEDTGLTLEEIEK